MNWEKEDVIKLIEEYRKQRCLWDVQVPQYKDKQKKCDAWKVLGNALNRDWVEVEKKMKSLIGQFQREMKKFKGRDDEEDEGDNPGQSKWFAFESMLFLKDKSKPHTTMDLGIQSIEDKGSSQSGSISAPSSPPRKLFKSPQKKQRKRLRNDNETTKTDKMAEEAYAVMKSLTANKDDSHLFGDYVASKLRLLSPPSRNRVQHKIHEILFAAVDEEYRDIPKNTKNVHMNGSQHFTPQLHSSPQLHSPK